MPPANALESLRDKDLYKLLEISEDSTKEAITKAYRKKALKCHPDKNPDNPKAAEMFHLLTQTLQVLTDVAARGAYDRCRKAKKATEERNSHLDAKRRKMKEDLEAREYSSKPSFLYTAPASAKVVPETPMSQFEKEVLRLRKEGSRLVEAEQERLREELKEQMRNQRVVQLDPRTSNNGAANVSPSQTPRLKVRWRVEKGDVTNGGVTQTSLSALFSQYGKLNFVLLSQKKPGSAIIEFNTTAVANSAFWAEQNGKFEMEWIVNQAAPYPSESAPAARPDPAVVKQARPTATSSATLSHAEYEAKVLERLAAASKRKQMDLSA